MIHWDKGIASAPPVDDLEQSPSWLDDGEEFFRDIIRAACIEKTIEEERVKREAIGTAP